MSIKYEDGSDTVDLDLVAGSSGVVSDSTDYRVTDGDGNVYTSVVIGDQRWLVENWKYNSVGSVVYDDDIANEAIYGRLYDWDMAMALTLPEGWRIPSSADWAKLGEYDNDNPGPFKEVGYDYWDEPNFGATNETGFSARGAGYRMKITGDWYYIQQKQLSYMWTTTEDTDPLKAMAGDLWYTESVLCAGQVTPKENYFSVRLVRDI